MKTINKYIVIGIIGIVILFGLIYIIKNTPSKQNKETPKQIQQKPMTQEDQIEATKKLLATDPTDPSHVSNIKYIQAGLEKYYNDKRAYPKKLDELVPFYISVLPKYSSQKEYFYAYYPKDKPTAYHIGTLLGGRNGMSPKAFAEDADFDSSKESYVNGFPGADPIYDLKGGK